MESMHRQAPACQPLLTDHTLTLNYFTNKMEPSPPVPRWQQVLLAIYKSSEEHRYCERLNRIIRGSRSYLGRTVKRLAEQGLITIHPMSKIKWLSLTDKGKRVLHSIIEMRTHLNVF